MYTGTCMPRHTHPVIWSVSPCLQHRRSSSGRQTLRLNRAVFYSFNERGQKRHREGRLHHSFCEQRRARGTHLGFFLGALRWWCPVPLVVIGVLAQRGRRSSAKKRVVVVVSCVISRYSSKKKSNDNITTMCLYSHYSSVQSRQDWPHVVHYSFHSSFRASHR